MPGYGDNKPDKSYLFGCDIRVTPSMIEMTQKHWRSEAGRELSRDEAREAVENLLGLGLLLHEMSQQEDRDQYGASDGG